MNPISDSKNLNKIIERLDIFLHEGNRLLGTLLNDYEKSAKKVEFDLNNYYQEKFNIYNNWFHKVYNYLESNFSFHYPLFHFIRVKKPAGVAIVDLPRKLSDLKISLEYHLYALEDVILRLEEKENILIRKEIAEKEYDADTLYRVTFSWHTREIKLNNMLLARPNSDSKNINFFEYVYAHPNEQIDIKDIETSCDYKLSNNIHDILRDLGFSGKIRKLFFPIVTKAKVMFVNPITKQYAIKNDLPTIKLPKPTRRNEK